MRQLKPSKNNNQIILRFRHLGKILCFTPVPRGRYDNPVDLAKATEIAQMIQHDRLIDDLDVSFQRYQKYYENREALIDHSIKPINLLQSFEDFTRFKSAHLRENSLSDYSRIVNKLKKCPYKRTNQSRDVLEWLVKHNKGNGTRTLNKQYMLLNACGRWLVACGKLKDNPFSGLKALIPSPRKDDSSPKIKAFTIEEMNQIIAAFYGHNKYAHYAPLVEFLFATGCRPCEAIALQWKHIKDGKIRFGQVVTHKGNIERRTKTEEFRDVSMNEKVAAIIERQRTDYMSPDDFVFPSVSGEVNTWSNFANRVWKNVLKSLPGIEYRNPYQTRHTAITHMIKGGANGLVLSKQVGNSPNTIHKHYLGDVSDIPLTTF